MDEISDILGWSPECAVGSSRSSPTPRLGQIRLAVAWQSIVAQPGGEPVGYEALMRTEGAERISPPEIFRRARAEHRVHEIERTMHELIAEQLDELDCHTKAFVNVHPSTLSSQWFYRTSSPLLRHADRVVIELPEAVLPLPPETLERRLRALRSCGFTIAIDDHGADAATIARAKRLRPDVLKLDRSLLRGLRAAGAHRRELIDALQLAWEMGIHVIGEGIEEAWEADLLVDLGVRWLQGYRFSRPTVTRIRSLTAPVSQAM